MRLWDAINGRLIANLGPTSEVRGVSFGMGGLLAVSCHDDSVRVWSTSSGKLIHTLSKHGGGEAAFSPQGRSLVTCTSSGKIRWWRTTDWVADGEDSEDFKQAVKDRDFDIRFISEDMVVVTYSYSSETRVNRRSETRSHIKTASGDLVGASPDGKLVLIGCQLWDLEYGRILPPPVGRRYHPDASLCVTGKPFIVGMIDLIDLTTEKRIEYSNGVQWVDLEKVGRRENTANGCKYLVLTQLKFPRIVYVPSPDLEVPQSIVELFVQVALRGELGSDGEFAKWDEPTWERKQRELAAFQFPAHPFPFPGRVANDRLNWLRAEYDGTTAKNEGERLANELLRRAETIGDLDEAVRWRAVRAKHERELAPPPRAVAR